MLNDPRLASDLTDAIFTLRELAQGFRHFALCTATRLPSSAASIAGKFPYDVPVAFVSHCFSSSMTIG
jgi:hypothetical protein